MRAIPGLVITVLAGCASTWTPAQGQAPNDRQADAQHPSLFEQPWVWLDDRGERVTFGDWRGTPFIVAAVYTTCQETCPRTLAKMRGVYDQYVRENRPAAFIVVTIDPDTDTPERLRDLRKLRNLPNAWHLVTGGTAETQALADLLGVHIMRMDTGVDDGHMVHDSKIVLFDRQGRSVSELDVL